MSKPVVMLHESGDFYEVWDPQTGERWSFEAQENNLNLIQADIRVMKTWYKFVKSHPETQFKYEEAE